MLSHIQIRNFAIVDLLELDLAPGMSCLTGETGAGKSIILDALSLALGDRAESGVVRHGCDRAEISANFDLRNEPAAQQWLLDHELEMEGECIIRRTLTKEGRSKGYINGRPQPLATLRELGEMLVDIHGQHAHQALLRREQQRDTLDQYAGNNTLLKKIDHAYRHWSQLTQELERLRNDKQERDAKLELLRYQARELENLNPQPDELEQLDKEHQRLAHAHRLLESSQQALHQLQGDEQAALTTQLQRITHELNELQTIDHRLQPICEMLDSATIQMDEAATELRHYQERIEIDPQQLQQLEARLGELHEMARKHNCQPQQLAERLHQLQQQLSDIETAEVKYGSLEEEIATATAHYRTLAEQLTLVRQKAAKKLEKAVTKNLQRLSMNGSRFEIAMTPHHEPSPQGQERVEFLICTNPGQPAQPMNKIASGGELSRISLAIQVVASRAHGITTVIFDEVDVGIGGGTAEIVGQMLRALGESRQVLCITHQPQVAAQGNQHLQVCKKAGKSSTTTTLVELDQHARIDELARMLGGITITEQTRVHAREMLLSGQPR
ncbi:MAG: DNA repair protein RecN [Gammaproteobacteria bacterium]|nr:DNA repair protein RecN [Gammaproteobacteria bacterium]MCF6229589.1 DNA repair protein RecN [Gammaproteobacteria bacterium]